MTAATIYEEGDPNSPICFIGEAPSFEEIRQGRPFCGPAGQLFERCLHASKISRRESYILNVFPEMIVKPRDQENKIISKSGELLWTPKGFTQAGRELAAPTLERINRSNANVIVPMGAPALSLVLDNRSITKWRGSILAGGPQISHRKVVPTIHPSAAIRGVYEWRYLIINDMRRAYEEQQQPTIHLPQRNIIISPSFAQAQTFLKRALDADRGATDIEILRGQVDCFCIALSPSECIVIPLIDHGFEPYWPEAEELELWRLYQQFISSPRIEKINQNITFDFAALLQLNNIVPAGPVNDPMVAHSVMNPQISKSLGMICSLYTREPYYKDDGELKDSFTIKDFEQRWRYNGKDGCVALEGWDVLRNYLVENDYTTSYNIAMDPMASLIYMMVHGIRLNEHELIATRNRAREDLRGIIAKLEVAFGRPIINKAPKTAKEKRAVAESGALNVNSPAQLVKYFYGEKKLRPYTNQQGAMTTDDRTLARIFKRDGLQEAKLLQDYRAADKMLGTYLEMGYDSDKRIRCSYNIRGTWTGRLSSQKTVFDTGGNYQNLPPEMRMFLEADPLEEFYKRIAEAA